MRPLDRAGGILRQTESELRKLLSEAAQDGDYAAVLQIAGWARSLKDLIGEAAQERSVVTPNFANSYRHSAPPRPTSKPIAARPGSGNNYPRFLRQGDRLVRVSWSKRERKEYEHKAPLTVLKTLVDRITERGADGRVFSADELFPLRDRDGVDAPNYQVYAALSLLRQVGLVDQHGRQGYSVPDLRAFKPAAEAVWQKLPEK